MTNEQIKTNNKIQTWNCKDCDKNTCDFHGFDIICLSWET